MVSRRALLFGLASAAGAQAPQRDPYRGPRNTPLEYAGPGRSDPEPSDLREVCLGWFGPPNPEDPQGGAQWQGATLAIEEANRHGGYRGLPFRLAAAWAENPWAGGAAQLIRTIYREKVWAVLGGIDGATTHLAEQVVTKALVTLVNPAATDRSIHSANVPWMFSCAPGDHLQAALISHELKRRGVPFAAASGTDHDSRALISELKLAFSRDRISPVLHVESEVRPEDVSRIARQLAGSGAQAMVVIAGAGESADLIKALRGSPFAGTVFAAPSILRAAADPALEGVLYPVLGDCPDAFRARIAERFRGVADYTAAQAYDAANVVIAAIRRAGLNRARIRDAVRALSPFHGVTGTIEWDPAGQNHRPVRLGRLYRDA
jgi:branched-chain amino acid transport system substrate-binding protein